MRACVCWGWGCILFWKQLGLQVNRPALFILSNKGHCFSVPTPTHTHAVCGWGGGESGKKKKKKSPQRSKLERLLGRLGPSPRRLSASSLELQRIQENNYSFNLFMHLLYRSYRSNNCRLLIYARGALLELEPGQLQAAQCGPGRRREEGESSPRAGRERGPRRQPRGSGRTMAGAVRRPGGRRAAGERAHLGDGHLPRRPGCGPDRRAAAP